MKKPHFHELPPKYFCPVRHVLRILGKRWTILIIKEINFNARHKLSFMELRKKLEDVSAKVLSERLKEMQANGLVNRKVDDNKTPQRIYYTLTGKGKDACQIIEAFREYGIKWGDKETFNCSHIDCEVCGKLREEQEA